MFKTHHDIEINIDDTHLQGSILCSFSKLRKIFNEPMDGDGCKTDAEWRILFDSGHVATIYNWKNGYAHLGEDGLNKADIVEWNVGGSSPEAMNLVARLIGTGVRVTVQLLFNDIQCVHSSRADKAIAGVQSALPALRELVGANSAFVDEVLALSDQCISCDCP